MYVIVTNKNHHQMYYAGINGKAIVWVPTPISAATFTTFANAEQFIKSKLRSRVDVLVIRMDSIGT